MKRVGNQTGASSRCHEPSAPWQRENFGAHPFARNAGALRGDLLRGGVRQIAHRLPADGRVRIEQPVDSFHGAIITPALATSSYEPDVAPGAPF